MFPAGLVAESGPDRRKKQVDTAIMATIVLDLQPFNQVNRLGSEGNGAITFKSISFVRYSFLQGWVPDAV